MTKSLAQFTRNTQIIAPTRRNDDIADLSNQRETGEMRCREDTALCNLPSNSNSKRTARGLTYPGFVRKAPFGRLARFQFELKVRFRRGEVNGVHGSFRVFVAGGNDVHCADVGRRLPVR